MNKYINLLPLVFLAILFLNCKSDRKSNLESLNAKTSNNQVIDVITEGMEFQMVDSIPYGWNTFRYHNKSHEVHFFILEKLPAGIRIDNYKNELIPPFKKATELLLEGKVEDGLKEFENIPAWFSKLEESGGVGLVSSNTIGESTIYLEPGIYAMECYIRMPNGMAHVYYGMLKEVVVTEEKSTITKPESTINLSISSTEGIVLKDSVTSGKHIFSVHFKDQIKYKTMLGHDVNLVRLEDFSQIDTLSAWINAADLKAFRSPEPKGLTFLGGVNDAQAGSTGYFKAKLKPGNYALISEIPNSKEKGMLKTFVVSK